MLPTYQDMVDSFTMGLIRASKEVSSAVAPRQFDPKVRQTHKGVFH